MIRDFFVRNVSRYPDGLAYRFIYRDGQEQTATFAQFNAEVNRLASGMASLGISKEDRVAILSPNCLELLIAFGAAEKGAFIAVPLNVRLHPNELQYIIENAEAIGVIVHEKLLHLIHPIRDALPTVKHWVVIGEKQSEAGMISLKEIAQSGSEEEFAGLVSAEDPVYFMYTSGTTGRPKGVMIAHRSPEENAKTVLIEMGTQPGYRMLSSIPLYHVGGKSLSLNLFARGGTNIILEKFDPVLVLDLLESEGIEILSSVPTLFHDLLSEQRRKPRDLSRLRTIFYSGSPVMEVVLRQMIEIFGEKLFQVYGMTETGPTISVLPKEDHLRNGGAQILSCGRPAFSVEVKVVGEDKMDLPAGEIGEIAVKSPHLLLGYWRNEKATAESLQNGWFYTGDMGKMDGQGYLYILDRKKDMIVSGGENIYPREIEEVLSKHPDIEEVVVIGVPDEKWGEAVKAVVVAKPGSTLTADEVISYAVQHLASYKKPKSVDFVDELPKNATGKILKNVVRQPYWEGKQRMVN